MTTASYQLSPPSAFSAIASAVARAAPLPKGTSVAGQTAIITGGNAGLGFASAKQLLELGLACLILGVRNQDKGEDAAAQLRKLHPAATIQVWLLDMLSYQSIQNFVGRCEKLDRLDLAILNAGAMADKFTLGPEGHEKAFQTNYLSTVYLAHLLLPTLRARAAPGKPGRLTVVNSATAYQAKFPKRDVKPLLSMFDDANGWEPVQAYCNSKAVAHPWVMKLAEKVRKEDVIVNIVDPGLVEGTSLHRDQTGVRKLLFALVKPLTGRSMEVGASTYIHAAVVLGPESHGSYIMDWKISPYIKQMYEPQGEEFINQIWNETLDELAFANLRERLDAL